MKQIVIFNKTETMVESITSDFFTFAFLILCMWLSWDMGGGWWTFFTTSMFLASLSAKTSMNSARVEKLKTKQEAIEWANSLPDDGPNVQGKARE